ncbi:MAG: 1-deoxy-D-xylulose-5-phosphate synthase [Firmicutes bacterium]|nr:1-deoxy-D-xylulose-5-phosphate synthase [Bacillota bacterium]
MRLLPTIDSPADLRRLNMDELDQLASEIREYIIKTVAETGGHLAASLGAVELTLALHYVLDTPADKLIFDVGHQCYAHKIITGRREQFATLRQSGGISGFCNRDESEYDVYTSGHASDSLSLALGLASARSLNGGTYRVATVIGDGALTGGMAFEAMNQAGDSGEPMIVVLNDNEMSIDGNVGALSRRLSRLRSGRGYNRAKDRTRKVVESLPLLGRPLYRFISRSKSVLKKMLVPSGIFFEEIGFVYLGPIDGHDIPTIIDLLQQAVDMNKPVLLHLRTVKGKGYGPAQTQPDKWHGAVPFNIGDGSPKVNGKRSFTAAFGEHICQLAEKDRRICAISAAMTEGTGLQQFAKRFPQRFYDTGITEQHAAGLAAGLALAGMRPVLAVYSTFLQRA